MYSLTTKYSEVGKFECNNQKLVLWLSNELLVDNILVYKGDIFSFNTYHNNIYIKKNSIGDKLIVNHTKNIHSEFNLGKDGFIAFLNEEEILRSHRSTNFKHKYISRLNLLSQKDSWTIEYNNLWRSIVQSNRLFLTNQKDINAFNVSDGNLIWSYMLSNSEKSNKIIKLIGIWNNELIIACSNHQVLSINIDSGEQKREWSKIEDFVLDSDNQGVIPKPESFVLDKENGILLGAINTFYFEINLTSDEVKYYDLKDELKNFNIYFIKQINDNPYTDEHLFLTAMMKQSPEDDKWSYDCIIALNRKTYKIDWHCPFEEANLGTNIPKICGDKLFQLDTNHTLHIFEKE